MEGLFLGTEDKYLEKVTKKHAELKLLARGDGIEVILHKISSGKTFSVYPGDAEELMEYFYITEGSVSYDPDNNNVVLKKGEYFYVHHLKEQVKFTTLEDTTLLYVTTQPVFHYISDEIKQLTGILEQVQDKDMYTHNHCNRVSDYSLKIAEKLHLSKERQYNVSFASRFHDIGKVYVPDEVLNKPGRLTDEEMAYIKKHPGDGERMVTGTIYGKINKIIEQHHEKLDGSGYPNGLKGDEITIEARIIAVADTYDAMTTDRPYRIGLTPETAVQELRRCSGTQFDSSVVKAFEEILIEDGIITSN